MHQDLETQSITDSATASLLRRREEEKPAERAAGQQASGPRKFHPTRAGTRGEPYERKKDGVKTVKVAFSGSEEFVERLRVYTARLPPEMPRNTWMQRALENAMARNAGMDSASRTGPRVSPTIYCGCAAPTDPKPYGGFNAVCGECMRPVRK